MRGYDIATEAGIENVSGNDDWLFRQIRQYAEAMHAAEHLAECQIQRTQIGLAVRGFTVLFIIMHMAVTVVRMRVACAAARVPGGMYQCALLRDEQDNNTQIMKKMSPHFAIISPRPDFAGGTIYFVTVNTASVSR